MAKTLARAQQAALQQDGAIYVPNFTWSQYYQPNAVKSIAGKWEPLKQGAISNSSHAEPLQDRRGAWVSEVVEEWELDVRRNSKEQAILFGAYDTSAAYPITLAAGVYDHRYIFDVATRRYLTGVYTDEDGGVYTHISQEPAIFSGSFGEGYAAMSMTLFGTHVCHAQASPTTSVATYNGRAFVRQASRDGDASTLSYVVAVDTAGAIDGSTAKLKSKLSTDGGYGAARVVTNNIPWDIENQSGVPSGLQLMLTTGGAGGGGNSLDAADTFTVSTRGTAPSPTIPTGQTVCVPRKYEVTALFGGAAFRKRPKVIDFVITKGIHNQDYGIGTDISNSHPMGDGVSITGSFQVEAADMQFLQLAQHGEKAAQLKPLKITFAGEYVGASVVYRQEWELQLDQIQLLWFDRDMLNKPKTPVVTVPWKWVPTTPNLLDGAFLRHRNGVANELS